MRALAKIALRLVVALVAFAAMAASAQAITITPPGPVSGVTTPANDPTLRYDTATVVCDQSTADGTITGDATINTFLFTVQGNCNVNGQAATVACAGTLTLTATFATGDGGGGGTVALNSGFSCTVEVGSGVCHITVSGPQSPAGTWTFNNGALYLTLTSIATATGSTLCGPPSGELNFTAMYDVPHFTITDP